MQIISFNRYPKMTDVTAQVKTFFWRRNYDSSLSGAKEEIVLLQSHKIPRQVVELVGWLNKMSDFDMKSAIHFLFAINVGFNHEPSITFTN